MNRLAKGLGWFSVALGSIEVLAPGPFARAIGTSGSPLARAVTCVCGLREIASGAGILTTPRPAGWVTSRVVGDVTDLSLLMVALASRHARRPRLLAAAAAVVGVSVLDAKCAQRLSGAAGTDGGVVRVRRRITVNRSPEELYRFWRDHSNLPRFMKQIESVRTTGERHSHWAAKGPLGMRFEWDAEITEDRPNQLIAWRSLPGSRIATAGVVRFEPAPGGRGTEVTVEMEYTPPGREVTTQLARLIGQAPEQQVQDDLRRFKQLMETGQIVASEGVLEGVGRPPEGGRRRSRAWRVLSMVRGGAR